MDPVKKVYVRVVLALGVWAAISLAGFFALRHFSTSVEERSEARRTSIELQRLGSLMTEAESGQRGYLLTGDPAYLTPYRDAVLNLPKRRAALQASEQAQTTPWLRSEALDPLIEAKMAELRDSVNTAREQGLEAARRLVLTSQGRILMDDIRREIDNEQDSISRNLERLDLQTTQESRAAAWALILSNAAILGIVFWSFRLLQAEVSVRQQAEAAVGELNHKLQVQIEELKLVNSELEAFSYSVSHDLRAPLRHINGFVELLNQDMGPGDAKSRRYLGIISDSGKQMGRLIDDLLVFSRMSRTEMQKNRVSLEELADQCIDDLKEEALGRVIQWKRRPLPMVEGDRTLLYQVFFNLISNAVKYSRPRQTAEIEIGGEARDKELVLYVRDNGVGFDMQYSHKLFGVFQRLHRAEEFEGTGIGLANVRRIVHRHGGRTWAEGKLNEGATFFFSLPLNSVHVPAAPLPAVSETQPGFPLPHNPKEYAPS